MDPLSNGKQLDKDNAISTITLSQEQKHAVDGVGPFCSDIWHQCVGSIDRFFF